ncbi:MAG: potassium channel protein [Chloroflexi bacterium]|nr:potassium channel protein [Chloroflexota bacterium]
MRRFALPLAALAVLFALGTAWYALVEDFGWFDGLYMVVVTLTTVGYEEVHPLDDSGRAFTILFVLSGVGLMFYTAVAVVEQFVASGVTEGLGERRRSRRIRHMENHIVVCGFGRVGQEIARELGRRGEQLLIVDLREDALARAREAGHVALLGDATEEAVLAQAGLERARALIAAADSDVENAFTVLTARALNAELFIVARAGSASGEQRLTTAGANRVVSPYQIAGRRMALAIAQPLILEFVDLFAAQRPDSAQLLAEIEVAGEAAGMAGRTIAEVFEATHETRVLGLLRADGEFIAGPQGGTRLRQGDRLMIFGAEPEIATLAGTLDGGAGHAHDAAAPAAERG